jgi:hypothetical protein
LCVVLSLVNLGSPEALDAMLSLNQCAVLGSYIIAIGCKINARVRVNLPRSLWSLGRCGLYVDIFSVLLLAPLFVFAMFPGSRSANVGNMSCCSDRSYSCQQSTSFSEERTTTSRQGNAKTAWKRTSHCDYVEASQMTHGQFVRFSSSDMCYSTAMAST